MSPRASAVTTSVARYLGDFRDQIRKLVPSAFGRVQELPHRGGVQVSLTLLASVDADTLDLCVLIRPSGSALTIEADLSEGGSGRVLSEWTEREASDAALEALRMYVDAQCQEVALLLTGGASAARTDAEGEKKGGSGGGTR